MVRRHIGCSGAHEGARILAGGPFRPALGIGPNTAIFSIVYATLLEPLPYARPDQLVMVRSMMGDSRERTSPADYFDWKEQSTSFQYLEAWWGTDSFNLASQEAPVRVNARQTSPDGHRMFGEPVWLGRDFRANEDQPGENRVVLLTHQVWREHFGANPDIIGRDVRLDGVLYTVIGVLQPGSRDRQPADLWIPLTLTPEEIAVRDFRSLLVTGRLKPGVTIEQAHEEMNLIADGHGRLI